MTVCKVFKSGYQDKQWNCEVGNPGCKYTTLPICSRIRFDISSIVLFCGNCGQTYLFWLILFHVHWNRTEYYVFWAHFEVLFSTFEIKNVILHI